MKYIALDIGCIECGEKSAILGVFKDKQKAEEVVKKYSKIQNDNWHGQHYFEVYEIKKENVELYNEETYLKHVGWFGDDEE